MVYSLQTGTDVWEVQLAPDSADRSLQHLHGLRIEYRRLRIKTLDKTFCLV
jgi:hypothetical protein